MIKFTKIGLNSKLNNVYLYRGLQITDLAFNDNPYRNWVVRNECGSVMYENGNGTRKEMSEWIDDYIYEIKTQGVDA